MTCSNSTHCELQCKQDLLKSTWLDAVQAGSSNIDVARLVTALTVQEYNVLSLRNSKYCKSLS